MGQLEFVNQWPDYTAASTPDFMPVGAPTERCGWGTCRIVRKRAEGAIGRVHQRETLCPHFFRNWRLSLGSWFVVCNAEQKLGGRAEAR